MMRADRPCVIAPRLARESSCMTTSAAVAPLGRTLIFEKAELGRVIDRLWQEGYTVVGPRSWARARHC